ncbi:tRNA (adenosine(37)-N6)-threonylcarbamoyltransferase complex dimerization subunit type 1 TsaB [Candidatus Saccharibacteria bacterium]|nr:MAG: tRNA (adenosine(37)-N6)-threonylcarbamoyltransferase complex dimerization subunit type 1 TsaB [Candidatus Saccharibacteria bacterium]
MTNANRHILCIRTDKPEAELALYDAQGKQLDQVVWHAHRQLAETLHAKIVGLLHAHGAELHDIAGIVAYQGPGSFTGLRIGLSVANALADAVGCPIVAGSGSEWESAGVQRLVEGQNDEAVLPEYGAAARVTKPRK